MKPFNNNIQLNYQQQVGKQVQHLKLSGSFSYSDSDVRYLFTGSSNPQRFSGTLIVSGNFDFVDAGSYNITNRVGHLILSSSAGSIVAISGTVKSVSGNFSTDLFVSGGMFWVGRHYVQAYKTVSTLITNNFQTVPFDTNAEIAGITRPNTASFGISRTSIYLISYHLLVTGSNAAQNTVNVRVMNTGAIIPQSEAVLSLNQTTSANMITGSLVSTFIVSLLSGANITCQTQGIVSGSMVGGLATMRSAFMITEM